MKNVNNLIKEYCENWIGCGNPKSKVWFIGLEPGGGTKKEEFHQLLAAWKNLDRGEFIDVVDFHKMIISSKKGNLGDFHFGKNPRIQNTWGKLIYTQLTILGKKAIRESVREFQKNKWCRIDSDNCIAELLPLPSPKISAWNYNEWFPGIDFLKTRQQYKHYIIEGRISKIKDLISRYKPKVIVFYGKMDEETKLRFNLNHINEKTEKIFDFPYSLYKSGNTEYYFIAHPASIGIVNEYYIGVGKRIREELEKN